MNRDERLILGTGRQVVFAGQIGEKLLHFLLAGQLSGHLAQCFDVAAERVESSVARALCCGRMTWRIRSIASVVFIFGGKGYIRDMDKNGRCEKKI